MWALLAVVVLAVLLRVFNIGHVLMYDEAWNANSIVAFAGGSSADVFYSNFYRHPPLYTGLGVLYVSLTGSGRHGLSIALEILSLVFSAGLVVAIFYCGRDWFGEKAGLAAAFLFAVMPAARVYDSVIKQESMTLFFGTLFLLLFFRRKYVFAGLMLGLSMLSKEVFIFVPAALLFFILASRRFEELRGLAKSAAVGLLLSFWWYAFFSNSGGEFVKFFLGRSEESENWARAWHFYLGRVHIDTGWVVFALAAAGAGYFLTYALKRGWPNGEFRVSTGGGPSCNVGGEAGECWQMALMPVMWVVLPYAFLSVSVGKPPWLIYAALPGFALLGGFGLAETARVLSSRPAAARSFVAVALVAALALSLPVGFGSFLNGASSNYSWSLTYEKVAAHMNSRMQEDGRVMVRLNDFSPNLAFYLKSYNPESVALLPPEPSPDWEESGQAPATIMIFRQNTSVDEIARHVVYTSPDFLMIRPGLQPPESPDPAVQLETIAEPVKIDGVWVFDGRELRRALAGP